MIVYRIKVGDQYYIGSTVRTLTQRKALHKYDIYNRNMNTKLAIAVRDYGWENITMTVIDNRAQNYPELHELERRYIKKYDTYENGLNSTPGDQRYKDCTFTYNPSYQPNLRALNKSIQESVDSRRGRKRAVNKHNKYTYILISPQGKETISRDLVEFCRERKLNYGCMSRVSVGTLKQYKGWSCGRAHLLRQCS